MLISGALGVGIHSKTKRGGKRTMADPHNIGHINRTLSGVQLKQLTAELVPGLAQEKPGRAGMLYLKASYIHTRLNQIWGFDGWGQEILSIEAIPTKGSGYAFVAQVRLTVWSGGTTRIIRDGVGVGEHQSQLDAAYKGAVSDAIKRAARTFGTQFAVMPEFEKKVRQKVNFWQACSKVVEIFAAKARPKEVP